MNTKQTPRRGRPPSSDGRATQERILDAALEIFAERGFGGATVRQIAAKVGVSDPALYAHFKGKQAIFEALMREAGPDLLGVVAGDKPLIDMPARTAIPEVFGAIVLAWTKPRARAFTSLMLRMGPEGIGNALREVSERLQPAFSAWQARGDIRNDIPAEVAVWQVIGPLSGLRMTYLHGIASEADVAHAVTLANAHLAQVVRSLNSSEEETQ
ncbi:TetR/AcrR family transcriptional regulator [Roseibium algae]|uniref:TetR/AcrR family transcriptional regulator n=1 Tax=Roseibium algae TaxID=3123038 RepID=A0ABU8TNW2_9HYPH